MERSHDINDVKYKISDAINILGLVEKRLADFDCFLLTQLPEPNKSLYIKFYSGVEVKRIIKVTTERVDEIQEGAEIIKFMEY